MNKSEAERLAVLEIEFKHVSSALAEMKDANAELSASIKALRETITGWDNQFKGGRTVLAALFSLAAAAGGGVVWVWQHLPSFRP